MPEARIGGPSGYLLLAPPAINAPTQAIAVLELNGLTAVTTIAPHWDGGFNDLATFFSTIERKWRGWRGTLTWQSLEGELTLAALHYGGIIQLKVSIRNWAFDQGNNGWSAEGDLTIEPGEELTRISRAVAAFADVV